MRIKGKKLSIKTIINLAIYYGILYYLPGSSFPLFGKFFKFLRFVCCKRIFMHCGHNVNIERGAFFGSGSELSIGDYSGLGYHCVVPSNTNIGNYVMMGPNCYMLGHTHNFDSSEVPMMFQGTSKGKQIIIEDDVWLGRNVTITSGRIIKKGTIVGIGSVLTKDFPEFSIVGGNPAKLIRSRQ